MTLNTGAFEALDENEMLAVDGGTVLYDLGISFVTTGFATMCTGNVPAGALVCTIGALCLIEDAR